MMELTAAVIFGLAWRWLDHRVHKEAVANVPVEYSDPLDRKEAYINAVLGPCIEEPVFRWWLVLFSGTELITLAFISALAFQVLHRGSTPWFYYVFGLVLTVMVLLWGWQMSLVAHLAFNISGALYIAARFRRHRKVSVSCAGNR